MTDDAAAIQLAGMIRDTTAARGVDWWATELQGYSAAEWAELTGRVTRPGASLLLSVRCAKDLSANGTMYQM